MEGVTSLQVSADGNSGYHGSPACDSASLKWNSKIQFSGSFFTKADSLPVGRNASLSHSVPAGEKEGEPATAGKGGMAYCKEGNRIMESGNRTSVGRTGLLSTAADRGAQQLCCRKETFWVDMKDENDRLLLVKEGTVLPVGDKVRLEIPMERMPRQQMSLQIIAIDEKGEVFGSRIIRIKAED